jgi:hypothetical protein
MCPGRTICSICSLDFMSDGFTVAAGTQNGKVLIYDLRALGSGGSPAKSFDAHSHTHVSCVTFQHAPTKSAKGKPKVGGKENAKPTTVAAAAANINEAPTLTAPPVANAPGCARFHARGTRVLSTVVLGCPVLAVMVGAA